MFEAATPAGLFMKLLYIRHDHTPPPLYVCLAFVSRHTPVCLGCAIVDPIGRGTRSSPCRRSEGMASGTSACPSSTRSRERSRSSHAMARCAVLPSYVMRLSRRPGRNELASSVHRPVALEGVAAAHKFVCRSWQLFVPVYE